MAKLFVDALEANGPRMSASGRVPRVYLAGPMVFLPEERMIQVFARMKEICTEEGLCGVAPIDGQANLVGMPPGDELYERIVSADNALMDATEGAIICFDPFRGTEIDGGTGAEVGYMRAKRKPMTGWTTDTRDYVQKVRDYFGGNTSRTEVNATGASSGVERDPDGMMVHSQGCYQNGMLDTYVKQVGGEVFANPDWEVAFRKAAKHLNQVIIKRREESLANEAAAYIPYA